MNRAETTMAREPRPESQVRVDSDILRELLESRNDAFYALDADGVITYVSPAIKSILGYVPEELQGTAFAPLVHADDLAEVWRAIEDVKNGHFAPAEFRIMAKSGETRWVRTSSRPLLVNAEYAGLCGVLIDISPRKQAELQLRESETRLRAITDSAMDAIIMIDPRGFVTFWNPAAERMFGYTSVEAVGQTLPSLIAPPHCRDKHDAAFAEFHTARLGGAAGATLELDAHRKDGSELPVALSLSAVQVSADWCAVGIVRDISAIRKSSASLMAGEQKLRQILDNAHDAFVSVDAEGVITNWNARAESLFGWTLGEAIGAPFEMLMPKRLRGKPDALVQWGLSLLPNQAVSYHLETLAVASDGREFPVEATLWSISVDGAWQVNVFMRDLTEAHEADRERIHLEGQLRHAQKLEAIGALAAGISHEINTPTQYIGDNIRFLASAFADLDTALAAVDKVLAAARDNTLSTDTLAEAERVIEEADLTYLREEVPAAIAQAEEGVQRVSAIVRAMKEFAHPGPLQHELSDLNKAIESTATICRNEWKYVADLNLDLQPDLPLVPCQIGEIKQVILNLIVNAAHAIENVVGGDGTKGTITLATGVERGGVIMRVSDTGSGIPDSVRDRVFDPFFTTKPVGKGSGQGLAIAYNVVVNKHQGTITFESALGRGTDFVVWLPLKDENGGTTGSRDEEAHSVRG